MDASDADPKREIGVCESSIDILLIQLVGGDARDRRANVNAVSEVRSLCADVTTPQAKSQNVSMPLTPISQGSAFLT